MGTASSLTRAEGSRTVAGWQYGSRTDDGKAASDVMVACTGIPAFAPSYGPVDGKCRYTLGLSDTAAARNRHG